MDFFLLKNDILPLIKPGNGMCVTQQEAETLASQCHTVLVCTGFYGKEEKHVQGAFQNPVCA